jgi:TonB-dependent starch-binding outer membrane protein SusC
MKKFLEIVFLLFCAFPIYAQNNSVRTIRGTVTDKASGEVLAGVTVVVPGTSIGNFTDNKGNYSINVPAKDSVLQFSFVGYTTQTVHINNQTLVDVALIEKTQKLDEIVVVGYGTQKKSDLTGSISTVNVNDIQKQAVVSPTQALQGQVAGVDITSSTGAPGASPTVRIRGVGTINSADPLYVVDGMMVGDIDFVNSSDIESIQVLKDASASAIYGSRGANGVIIVTTKKGSKGDATISFSSYYGVQNAWKSSNMMDGPTWSYLRNESLIAAGYAPAIDDPASQPTTNWFKEICRPNAPISNVDISVSGGNEKSNYYMSINRFSQAGTIKKTDFDRVSFRSNATYEAKPWLTIGENVNIIKSNNQAQFEGDEWTSMMITSFMRDPVTPVRNADGSFTKSKFSDTYNPMATIEYTNNTYINYRTIGDIFANVKLAKGLAFKSDYFFQFAYGDGRDYVPVYYVFSMQSNPIDKLYEGYDKGYTQQWSNTLNYEKKFGDHSISFLLGAESYTELYKSSSITATNFPNGDPDYIVISNSLKNNSAFVEGNISEGRQLSGLARLNYSYKDKYLFTSNFRADGSSKFIKGKRWDYFPSFSFGWKISEEPFMKSISSVSSLKLRAGWGQIGNQATVGPYEYLTTASPGKNYIWGGALRKGYSFTSIGNPDLRWELTTTTNLGIDFGFFRDKLTGSVEGYVRKTSGMIMSVPLPGQTGVENYPSSNAGAMKNTGLELSMQYRNMDHAFNYSFGFNFSTVKNKVVSLGTETGEIYSGYFMDSAYLLKMVTGKPVSMFYGNKTDGLFQNQAEIDAQTAQTNVVPGDVRYVDADKDGKLDLYYLGSPLPKFTYSFYVNCAYKGFDLSINFQGVYGNKLYNGPSTYTRSSVGLYNLSRDMIHRWTGENTQFSARYPRMYAKDINNERYDTDRFIEDGSYLRVKTLQIGYSIKKPLLEKISVKSVRIYMNSQNLLTFTKYSGMDPEIGLDGLDRGTYPQARTYSMGLDVTF